jgi:hypothetical protein
MASTSVRSLVLLALTAPALAPRVAVAQEKCTLSDGEMIGALSRDGFVRQMDEAQGALDRFELNDTRYYLETLHRGLLCYVEVVRPTDLVRFARLEGAIAAFDQDNSGAARWGNLAVGALPDMPWPKSMPAQHPLRRALEASEEPAVEGPSGMMLAPADHAVVFLDGTHLAIPQARADTWHYVQIFDRKGALLEALWQDGANFRASLLAADDGRGRQPVPPKWWVAEDTAAVIAEMAASGAYITSEEVVTASVDGGDDFDVEIAPARAAPAPEGLPDDVGDPAPTPPAPVGADRPAVPAPAALPVVPAPPPPPAVVEPP